MIQIAHEKAEGRIVKRFASERFQKPRIVYAICKTAVPEEC